MEQPDTGKMTDEQRRLIGFVFLFIGVTDIALGVAIAVFGPGFIGGEPLVDKVLVICVCSSCATAELVIAKSQDGTWESIDDCRIWVTDDTPAIEANWQGDCPNGLAHGSGALRRTSRSDGEESHS